MADSPNKSSLNKLYNSQVTHADHVKRPLGTTPSGSKPLHEGVKVTLKSGDQYLVHKGPNFGKSSDTMVTPASNMKPGF
ncbi:hypothetical protein MAR_011497 [Mya arenaria]|uniref:Uncharacterized protein n=1 Tax=Mya arenaria TaxID=6604 RepID=A0ABY7FY26_MYAAR|nr:hypothetical protein MAR_011497 [Mya arenaria]